MNNIKTIQVQPASSLIMSSPMHVDVSLTAHQEYEQFTMHEFKKTPDFTIHNVDGYDGMLGKFQLVPELVTYGSRNTLWQRIKRLYNEKLYTVYSDGFDKLLTAVVLLGVAISAYYLYIERVEYNSTITKTYTYKTDEDLIELKRITADIATLEQQYQSELKKPSDQMDSELIKKLSDQIDSNKLNLSNKTLSYYNSDKLKALDNVNTDDTLYNLNWVKLGCTVVTSTLLTWHMFKRTTVHYAPNKTVNKLERMGKTMRGKINPSG